MTIHNSRTALVTRVLILSGCVSLLCTTATFAQNPVANVPPKIADPEQEFVFRSSTLENGRVSLYRFKKSTGEGWSVPEIPGSTWSKFKEPIAIPKAKYDFVVAGKAMREVFRFNRATGETWHLEKDSWELVREPKAK